MKKILGYIVILLHFSMLPIALYLLIYSQYFIYSYILLVFFTIILINWFLFGYCILTPIENYLLDRKKSYENNSALIIYIEKYLKISNKTINLLITIFPSFIISIILLKIYYSDK
jgi:hypothetical protein